MYRWFLPGIPWLAMVTSAMAQVVDDRAPTCEVVPLPHQEVSFQFDGVELLRWHAGADAPRPFFYPFNGPSGAPLTRMGHPGAPNHDHHRSIWWAHHDVDGQSFWQDGKGTSIRQKQWLVYEDGDNECLMAVRLGWFAEDGGELMEQDLIAVLRPLPFQEHELELQSTFRVAQGRESVTLGKTNFGFLAVRVAKSISAHFGGGKLTGSEGGDGEAELFEKPASWMDYSGPVAKGEGIRRVSVIEGITFFDHPSNPGYPSVWHVRDDGWMSPAVCQREGRQLTPDKPLTLRYLLHAHTDECDVIRTHDRLDVFSMRPAFEILESKKPHQRFEVRRIPPKATHNPLLPDLPERAER